VGKRSEMERNPRDLYRTFDKRAGAALLPHLAPATRFVEPCAGRGDLIDQMTAAGHMCVLARDIEPQREDIAQGDMFDITDDDLKEADMIIGNPPWRVALAHPYFDHFMPLAPMWSIFYADWLFTKQASRFIPRIKKVVAIGRLKWQEGTTMDGKDNAVWLYSEPYWDKGPRLFGRSAGK